MAQPIAATQATRFSGIASEFDTDPYRARRAAWSISCQASPPKTKRAAAPPKRIRSALPRRDLGSHSSTSTWDCDSMARGMAKKTRQTSRISVSSKAPLIGAFRT